MAKYAIALTNIKAGPNLEDFYPAGPGKLDVSKFTKEQLKALYDAGAIELKDDDTVEDVKTEEQVPFTQPTEPTEPGV
jgi:hypothetical protein